LSRDKKSAHQKATGQQANIAETIRTIPTHTRKLIALFCLVALWIIIILVQRHRGEADRPIQEAAALPATPTQREGPMAAPHRQTKERGEMPRLKLARIERVRPPYEPEARNIFASIEPSPHLLSALAAPSALATPPPPDPFLEEARQLRFLGFATAEGKMMAFVAYGGELLVVPETEVIGNKLRIKQVKEDAILVTSIDGKREIRLGLTAPEVAPPSTTTKKGNEP
jgi:hypothetical protein